MRVERRRVQVQWVGSMEHGMMKDEKKGGDVGG